MACANTPAILRAYGIRHTARTIFIDIDHNLPENFNSKTTYDTSTQSPNRADKPSYDLPNTYASQKNSFDKADDDITQLKELLSDRYCVIKKLGKGSQGSVFLAEDIKTQNKVAIKQLNIQSVKDWKQYDLFQREADVLKRLNIPGVAKLHETLEILDTETPMALIVQDYIAGEPLQKFINNGHRFSINHIGEILIQLLDILKALHLGKLKIIHRDIKPSNILLNYTENSQIPEVHLIDFGAVSNPQVKGGGSTVVGTYGYMAPEQLMGCASAASDIYSLAIVAVYLLSGVPPEKLEIQDYHVLIDAHLEHLPYQVTAFLRKMLEPRADDRMTNYKKIRQFFNALVTQRFDDIPNVTPLLAKTSYSLKNVYSYRQTGNIILWQELSDKTPRSLPKLSLFKSELEEKLTVYDHLALTIFTIILLLSLLIFGIIVEIDDLQRNGFQVVIFIFALLLVIADILLIAFNIRSLIYSIKTTFDKTRISYTSFFKNARKSMATVVRIEYIPIWTQDEINTPDNFGIYTPTWKITYRFNPPDDSSPDDIIRTAKTHTEPDIKEGDLIPILYLIKDEGDKERILSTPYPIPVTDEYILAED